MAKLSFNATLHAEQLDNGDVTFTLDFNGERYPIGTLTTSPEPERPEWAAARQRTPAEFKAVADASDRRSRAALDTVKRVAYGENWASDARRAAFGVLYGSPTGRMVVEPPPDFQPVGPLADRPGWIEKRGPILDTDYTAVEARVAKALEAASGRPAATREEHITATNYFVQAENAAAVMRERLAKVCMLPDCGCTGEAHA